MKQAQRFKQYSVACIFCWLILFAFCPLMLVVLMSFMQNDAHAIFVWSPTLDNYSEILHPIYLRALLRSAWIALITTACCLFIAYPYAYAISQLSTRYKNLFLLLTIIPFWTSAIVRTYALIAMIKTHGIINQLFLQSGIIEAPLQMLYTPIATVIGLIYNLLPFMILPIYANLEKFDYSTVYAARDLGASEFRIFRQIMLPLSLPGILAGCSMVFLPAMTLFYIPELLGGGKGLLLGNMIQDAFMISHNWPEGGALGVVLTVLLLSLIAIFKRRAHHVSALQ